ncbi:hypothetical protein VK98_20945 [Chromobacterium sp. LK11]|uniref:sigma-54-dependent Fis family transcriptional regulator n=1 Tax=Chromobacterium sp. LK11 TaxID=1628212 RepID=UPI000654BB85|nr:sigma-54-dependent Fis family transcriptional regulator [Chromobacterium sp. LK11]KMN76493.1 hypothetical protein VK98_20945 [Chromobacterium sp. LK11]
MDYPPPADPGRLDLARRRFLDGEPLPAGLLPRSIALSWERSRAVGVRPWDRRFVSELIPRVGLSEADRRLSSCAKPEIERLWRVFGGQAWTLFCVNTAGVIVHAQHAAEPSPLQVLQAGRRVHEAEIGTTAPSCTLAEGQPAVVWGAQHYLSEFERFFCVSVPVHGVDGALIGALDITGIGERNHRAVLEQLCMAAMATENRLYASLADCRILGLQHDPRLIGTPLQGLLALDDDGRIRAVNRTARRLLGLENASGLGRHWTGCFERDPLSDACRQAPALTRLTDGSCLYVHLLAPTAARAHALGVSSPAAPLGDDDALNRQFDAARKAFAAGLPLLLLGETGTGKEVFARALHEAWKPDAPFVAINCSAIPESLIEAELFGYSDGAFTGARKGGAKGRIEEADGGTLLLDEIGDMPAALQTRLLRVLQERRVSRLGSSDSVPLDVRIVSATHCDLPALMAERRFREDLYYRLNGMQLRLPALRDRQDFDHLVAALLRRHGGGRLSPESRQLLRAQAWPGNIRQLEQTLRLAVVLSGQGEEIGPEHLPELRLGEAPPSSLKEVERQAIQAELRARRGNIAATASALGISRTTLYKRLKQGLG